MHRLFIFVTSCSAFLPAVGLCQHIRKFKRLRGSDNLCPFSGRRDFARFTDIRHVPDSIQAVGRSAGGRLWNCTLRQSWMD
jgi:hypothetical protein